MLTRIYLATAHTDLGAPDVALAPHDGISDAVTRHGEFQFPLPYLGERIRALAALHRTNDVERHIDRLLQALAVTSYTQHGAAAAEGEGWLALHEGDGNQAARRFEEADRSWLGLGFPLDRLRALEGACEALQRTGSSAEARRTLDLANDIATALTARVGKKPMTARSTGRICRASTISPNKTGSNSTPRW